MKTKLICLLLTLMTLLTLASCGDKERPMGDETTPSGDSGQSTQGGSQVTEEPSLLPDPVDLDDYRFIVNVRSAETGNGGFPCEDFWAESESSDRLESAVFRRNQAIQNDFNVSIEQVLSQEDQRTQIRNAYFGGEDFESAIVLASEALTLASEGFLEDLTQQPNINLDMPYWDANSVDQLSLGGSLFFVSGDSNINTLDNSVVTLFNKQLLTAYPDFESPYDMVDNNTWTMENMMAMAKSATIDTNDDGVDSSDQAGYFSYSASGTYYYYAAGQRVSTNDETGYPVITAGAATTQDVVDFLFGILNPRENTQTIRGASTEREAMFQVNHVLFTDMTLWDVRKRIRPLNIDYGIVPPPKYNESQDRYYSLVYFQDCVHLWTLPKTYTDRDKATLMMEVMAAYSTDTTMNAYYNEVLYYYAARDPKSIEMLDIVRTSQTYDIALGYDWGGFMVFLRNISNPDFDNSYATKCEQDVARATEQMNKVLDAFKNPTEPGTSDGGDDA